MKLLLDTDTCVYWLRGRVEVRDRWLSEEPDAMAVSIITVAELYYGAACSDNPDANRKAVSDFTGRLAVLPINSEAAALFGSIKARLREAGTLIEDMDLLIAATALAYDMTLVTNNVRHFDRIPNMRLESWASGV